MKNISKNLSKLVNNALVFGLLLVTVMTGKVLGQSGDGQILFSTNRDGNNEIYKMNADGSGQTNLTNTPENESGGKWSPDGQKIIYSKSITTGVPQIWVMSSDGSSQTMISEAKGSHSLYDWSPDGQKIVFVRRETGGTDQIWTMKADGTNKTRLTYTATNDHFPDWSPDGSKIAFGRCDNQYVCDVFTMNADGSNQINLTSDNSNDDDNPKWTNDGNQIVYGRASEDRAEPYIMSANGSNNQLLGNFGAQQYSFPQALSPDGSKVAVDRRNYVYTTREEYFNAIEIGVVGLDGSDLANITNNSLYDAFGMWSPDSAKIAFNSRFIGETSGTSGTSEIYTVNADGSALVRLTNNSANDTATDWRFIATTPAGQNVGVAPASGVNMTFSNVATAGETLATVLTPDQLQPLPSNFSLIGSSLMYNITTSAVFSGNITVTFDVPNIPSASACSQLRILHYVNNEWDLSGNAAPVYNSASQSCTLSQSVSSLSPFVVVQSNPPANVEQCKNNGWKGFDFPRRFKNQGDCIKFVNTGK